VRALLGFFTVLPISSPRASLEDAARKAYLLPFVGLLTGLPGAALLLLAYALPPGVAATLALGAVLLAAGLHHTDGVLDVGDALMVRGSPERRREVLKDTRIGVGGLGALFIVYAPPLAALATLAGASPLRAVAALLAGEVAVRSAMLLLLVCGKQGDPNSSSGPFISSLKSRNRRGGALVLALTLPPLLALPLGIFALLSALAAPVATVYFALKLSKRAFGGISGDVVGAAGELTRAALLVAFSATV
jgi:adenosylcobinamide-GDP ribazoletransferase